MYTTVMVLVKLTIQTTHKHPADALCELNQKANCTISDTPKVKIHETKMMDYKLKR